MAATQAACPSCGTYLTVTHESTVSVVCKRCRAVLELRNGQFRQVGTSAVVVPTRSSINVGEDGSYNGTGFQLTGHVQLSNEDGATWDEFYLGFSDGQCGWLAQAQGKLILSFRAPLPEGYMLPSFDQLALNTKLDLMQGLPAVTVIEKGEARVEAASGQMPYLLRPGETYPYADFAALSGAFASLDYSAEPPDLFVGREVTFNDLNMQPRRVEPVSQAGSAAPMVCTECGAPIEVRAPGKTERVTCLQCRAIFDVTSGRPIHAGSQEDAPIRPVVPVGSPVRFGAAEYTLMGFLQRSTSDDQGTTYAWQEYLLADNEGGYRWLVQDSENHWSIFEPITAGSDIQPVVQYGGKAYRFFQHGEARVGYLEGEFYWNAGVGQTSYTADFVSPPHMLAAEFSSQDSTKGEANWTHGVYVPVADVRKALGTGEIARPRGVAPNQPFPHKAILPIWLLSSLAIIAIGVLVASSTSSENVLDRRYDVVANPQLPPDAKAGEEPYQEVKEEITLKGGKNIRIKAAADLQSTWLGLSGLIYPKKDRDPDNPVVQPFEIPIEHFSGFDEGEAWDEGSKDRSVHLSALPEGEYVLLVRVYKDKFVKNPVPVPGGFGMNIGGQAPAFVKSFHLTVEQGYPRFWQALWACLILAIIPLIVWIMSRSFESRRWSNSNVNPSGT